jgi:dihydrofolate reductase
LKRDVPDLTFEGYAIVSGDGMLADATGVMPDSLKFEGDQRFFDSALDTVDLIVHGRNSFEDQPNSKNRKRVIATRAVERPVADPDNPKAVLWNPAQAPIEDAATLIGVTAGRVAIIGGTDIFDMFLDRYATFYLSQAPHLKFPGGVPVFHDIPPQHPDDILARHGLVPADKRVLDATGDVSVVRWVRKA